MLLRIVTDISKSRNCCVARSVKCTNKMSKESSVDSKEKPQYWLLKVEPSDYPWSQMVADGVTTWNGIRNHQAQKYLKTMRCDDLAFYYHTESEKAIVGIVKVVKEFYHKNDPKFGEIDVECVRPLKNAVTLKVIKETEKLQKMSILKQPRLSVSAVSPDEWKFILKLSEKRAES